MKPLNDIHDLRRRARSHMENGAITASYGCDQKTVVRLLNDALATELVCVLRYRRHHFMAQGIHSLAVADEFLDHATEELKHADLLARRIVQLGGEPDFNPATLAGRSHCEYIEGRTLVEMIDENLVAERVAIDSYRAILQSLGDGDSTTRRVIEEILAKEEEHADELLSLVCNFEINDDRKVALA